MQQQNESPFFRQLLHPPTADELVQIVLILFVAGVALVTVAGFPVMP